MSKLIADPDAIKYANLLYTLKDSQVNDASWLSDDEYAYLFDKSEAMGYDLKVLGRIECTDGQWYICSEEDKEEEEYEYEDEDEDHHDVVSQEEMNKINVMAEANGWGIDKDNEGQIILYTGKYVR